MTFCNSLDFHGPKKGEGSRSKIIVLLVISQRRIQRSKKIQKKHGCSTEKCALRDNMEADDSVEADDSARKPALETGG